MSKALHAIFCQCFLILALVSCSSDPRSAFDDSGPEFSTEGSETPTVETAPQTGHPPAEPGWESSGGSGVACYQDKETAEAVRQHLEKGQPLSQSMRESIVSLVTLESWENFPPLTPGYSGATYQEILDRVKSDLFHKNSPIFTSRLALVEEMIPLSSWQGNDQLELILDRNSKKPLEDHCVLVQLAVRRTRSSKGKLPETQLSYDAWLFENKLSAFDQALIILHEYLYLIGRETGHHSSDSLRTEVAQILSQELAQTIKNQKTVTYGARYFQSFIGTIFGDYYRFFVEDSKDKPAKEPEGSTQYSRFKSFGSMLFGLRKRKGDCLDKGNWDKLPRDEQIRLEIACTHEVMNPLNVAPHLNDEEAFVWASRWILDNFSVVDNSEILVDWNREDPASITPYQQEQLDRACRFLRTEYYARFHDILMKSRRYCETLK